MAEHLKNSEAEVNELLTEYWKLRHETGIKFSTTRMKTYIEIVADVFMETLANKLNMRVILD